MTCMFFLTLGVNEDIINEDDNKQVQVLFEHLFIKSMKVVGELVSLNNIATNS